MTQKQHKVVNKAEAVVCWASGLEAAAVAKSSTPPEQWRPNVFHMGKFQSQDHFPNDEKKLKKKTC